MYLIVKKTTNSGFRHTVICDNSVSCHLRQRNILIIFLYDILYLLWNCWSHGFPVAQMVEHGASNAKIMGSIPRESKS